MQLGRFELQERLGKGGMGEVWFAEDARSGESVAVKVIRQRLSTSAKHRQAFEREVRMMARLDHPSVVQILDYGTVAEACADQSQGVLTAGSPWLAMQYAAGGNLEQVMHLMNWQTLRAVLVSVLDALAHAHANGLVHRDIKPANILLEHTQSGYHVLVSDFGIAHAISGSNAQAIADAEGETEVRSGTPYYMAPEQVRGKWRDFGPWTDLYALGCVAYELACGRPPFEAKNAMGLWLKHLDEPPPAVQPRFGVPKGFEQWLNVLLEKGPRRRFQTAADAAWNLLLLDDDALIEAEPRPAAPGAIAVAQTHDHISIAEAPHTDPTTAETRVDPLGTHQQVVETRSVLESMLVVDDVPVGLWSESSVAYDASSRDISGRIGSDALTPRVISLAGHVRLPDYDVPAFPDDWRGLKAERIASKRLPPGTGLFGLRRLSIVGRHAERDMLWQELGRVFRQKCTRGVLVAGSAGVGKSHLLSWFTQQAQQLGAAKVIRVSHAEKGRRGDALRSALCDLFRAWRLPRQEVEQRVEAYFNTRLAIDDPEVARVIEDVDVPALTELMRPSQPNAGHGVSTFRFSDPGQRLAILNRLLTIEAAERPVILWLDEVGTHGESLSLARYLLREDLHDPLGCLVLISATRDRHKAKSGSDPQILGLLDLNNVRHQQLKRLSSEDQREIIEQMLDMTAELVDRLCAHTAGMPLFALGLLQYWLERDLLDKTDRGFELRDTADDAFPPDLEALWLQRLRLHLDALADGRADDAIVALEAAATLGRSVEFEEWSRLVELLDLEIPARLWDELSRHGLAEATPTGWRLAEASLREALEQHARDHQRLTRLHAACAQMLYERPFALETWRRRAQHLLSAGMTERALAPLLESGRELIRTSAFDEARAVLGQYRTVVKELDLPADDARRAADMPLQANICRIVGQPEKARRWATDFFEQAASIDDPAGLAAIFYVLAEMDRLDGVVARGARFYGHARRLFEKVYHIEGQVQSLAGEGWQRLMAGQLDRGDQLLEQAIELGADAARREVREELSWSYQGLAEIAWFRRDFDRAAALAQRAHKSARSTGMPVYMGMAYRLLADLAFESGDATIAWQIYQDALDILTAVDSRLADLARVGAAVVAATDGHYKRAHRLLEPLRAVTNMEGRYVYHSLYHSARLAVLAHDGDIQRWDGEYARLERLRQTVDFVFPYMLWAAEHAQGIFAARGDVARAARAGDLADEQRRRLRR